MTHLRTIEMQCSHARFFEMLPAACGKKPFEIVDNLVTVHDGDRTVKIKVRDEPIRHIGSLDLPMEEVHFEFPDHTEEEVDAFMETWREHTFRAGGG